jgi:DNA repair exonuclease SbcCD ATPase subunit
MDMAKVKERISELNADRERIVTTQTQVKTELSEWQYLKTACGKKGLQALEIDAVSPAIESYANELLISTFGPQNTIRLETQDNDMKEVLNIVVLDPDGSETMLENKSGGEKVWVLKALRLALTLLSKEKSGRNFKTVLMDEEDGALSPQNAVRFIGLYRSMMDLGGIESCYYISHKAEAVGLANHRLVFESNRIRID